METFVSAFLLFVSALMVSAVIVFYAPLLFSPYPGDEARVESGFRPKIKFPKSQMDDNKTEAKALEVTEMN